MPLSDTVTITDRACDPVLGMGGAPRRRLQILGDADGGLGAAARGRGLERGGGGGGPPGPGDLPHHLQHGLPATLLRHHPHLQG